MFPMLHGMVSQGGIVYLYDDLFATSQSPALDGNAEPGPGIRDFADPNGRFSISAASLALATSGSAGDTYLSHEPAATGAWPLTDGFAAAWIDVVFTSGRTNIGLGVSKAITPTYRFQVDEGSFVVESGSANIGVAIGTADRYVILRHSTGRLVFIKNNTVLWFTHGTSTADLYVITAASSTATSGNIGDVRVANLPAPFNTSTGLNTSTISGAVSAGATFTHQANTHILFTLTTLPASGVIAVRFRQQDANNYWSIEINSAGRLDLYSTTAGVRSTSLGNITGLVSGRRIAIVANGNTLAIYERTNRGINYTSASAFNTETDGEVNSLGSGGAITTLEAVPYTLPGSALMTLDSFFP